MTTLPEIKPEAFRNARESLGMNVKELAVKACLSVRQIEQIENGGQASYYNPQIKLTAARKVASLLGMKENDAFDFGIDTPTKEVSIEAALNKPVPVATATSKPVTQIIAEESFELESLGSSGPLGKPKQPSQKQLLIWLGLIVATVFALMNLRPLFFGNKPEETQVAKEEITAPASSVPEPVAETATTAANTEAPASLVSGVNAAATATAPAPALSPISTASAETTGNCPAESQSPVSYTPENPRKTGEKVYFQAKAKQVVCVVDATGKRQVKTLEPGVGISFYGQPPFKVLTEGLAQGDIYFQGYKVKLSDLEAKTLVLKPAEIQASN